MEKLARPAHACLHALGALHAGAILTWTLLSYRVATVFPYGTGEPREAQAFRLLSEAIPWWRGLLVRMGSGNPTGGGDSVSTAPVWNQASCVLVSCAPFAVLGLSFLLALRWWYRHRDAIDERTVAITKRWCVVFVLLALPAVPAFVQDFWLSLAWGRFAAAGLDPYTTPLDPSTSVRPLLDGIAVDSIHPGMTYGPFWALVSSAVMGTADTAARFLCSVFPGLAGGLEKSGASSDAAASAVRVLGAGLGAVFFKGILASAWIGCVYLVDRLLRSGAGGPQQTPLYRVRALLLVGWMPIAPLFAVAEGHNDGVLVFLMMLGLVWCYERPVADRIAGRVARMRWAGIVSLGCSVLVKYVTLPLLVLHLLDPRLGRRRWSLIGLSGVLLGVGLVPLILSRERLDPALRMIDWQFLTPREAARTIERAFDEVAGWNTTWLSTLVWCLPWVLGLVSVRSWWRKSNVSGVEASEESDAFFVAGFTLLFATALSLGHTWPWFLLWPLPLAAVVPNARLSLVFVSFALTAPFAFALVLHSTGLSHFVRFQVVSALWMLLAAAVWVALPRSWFDSKPLRATLRAG